MFKVFLLTTLLLTLGFSHPHVKSTSTTSTNWRVICRDSLNSLSAVDVNATDIFDALDQAHAGSFSCTAVDACNTETLECPEV
jgi:hypothetical protein